MGGQDLLDQGRARARQAENEDRVRRSIAGAGLCGEEVRRADLLLGSELGLHALGGVARLGALEPIALLIEGKAFGDLAAVFQRLAEGEAEMHPVVQPDLGRGDAGFHLRDLGFAETVGLQVGQRIPGIALGRAHAAGFAIGLDRFALASPGFQGVTLGGERRRVAGQCFQDFVEQGDGALIIPGLHLLDGEMGGEDGIARLARGKGFGLGQRGGEFLSLPEDLDIVEAQLDIVGLEGDRVFQQDLGVFENAEPRSDLGQKTHALDMFRLAAQEIPAHGLGPGELALGQEMGDRNQRLGQGGDALGLGAGIAGLFGPPRRHEQFGLGAPAGLQRRIELTGALIGGQRAICLAPVAGQVCCLLPGPAQLGLRGLQPVEQGFGLIVAVQIPRAYRRHVERLDIGPLPLQRRRQGRQRRLETAGPHLGARGLDEVDLGVCVGHAFRGRMRKKRPGRQGASSME